MEDETGERRIAGCGRMEDETGGRRIAGRGNMEDETGERGIAGRGKMKEEIGYLSSHHIVLEAHIFAQTFAVKFSLFVDACHVDVEWSICAAVGAVQSSDLLRQLGAFLQAKTRQLVTSSSTIADWSSHRICSFTYLAPNLSHTMEKFVICRL